MECKRWHCDLIFVTLAILVSLFYHLMVFRKVSSEPHRTTIGINMAARRVWVCSVLKDEKKSLVAVQSLRNSILGSTLMGSTSVLMCVGLVNLDAQAHGAIPIISKYTTMILFFLFAFLYHAVSITFLTNVTFLINIPAGDRSFSDKYVCDLMQQSELFSIVGYRLFFTALPLLLWMWEPAFVFVVALVLLVPLLYIVDFVWDLDRKWCLISWDREMVSL